MSSNENCRPANERNHIYCYFYRLRHSSGHAAFIMFHPKKENSSDSASTASYIPGVYASSLTLGSQEINVEVTVDQDQIRSVSMVPLSDSVETMFPLVQPSLEHLTGQICSSQSLENLSYPEETRYTSQVLIRAIESALEKARVK